MRRGALAWMFPLILIFISVLSSCGSAAGTNTKAAGVIQVVAAENFYGDITRQLGGNFVNVTSILSDPNTDPHEFTSNAHTALLVSTADIVIENGLGYDSWMDRLLSTQSNTHRVVLTGGKIAPNLLPDNPHVWYDINNMRAVAQAIVQTLSQFEPGHAATFKQNLQTFDAALLPVQQKIATIKQQYAGTPVALTETIYLYQTQQEGLNVLTPFTFMKAIAEGNDPPVDAITSVTNEINQRQVKVLIYNVQTVTPITDHLKSDANTQHIPLVPVSETMPAHQTYQTWMLAQLDALATALQQGH